MKRLCLFCFFDEDGILDDYVKHIICDLKKNVDDLYIAVNGKISCEGKDFIESNLDGLLIRSNFGFDAGAYADLLVEVIGKEKLNSYDELILCNDTFYGPFVSFESIFNKMEVFDYDFWGIDIAEKAFFSYIIPYFFVVGKRILQTDFLYDFFYQFIYKKLKTRNDVCAYFEVVLFNTLKEQGFSFGTFANSHRVLSAIRPDICIKKYGLPVWKKKFFSPEFYDKKIEKKLISYLKAHYDYDLNLILSSGHRLLEKKDKTVVFQKKTSEYLNPKIQYSQIRDFLDKYKKIYIYGLGQYAKCVYATFEKSMENNFKGFIVSDASRIDLTAASGQTVYVFKEELLLDAGLIVALNKKFTKEIKSKLGKRDNILYFW